MTAGEGGCGALAGIVGQLHQTMEQAIFVSWDGQHLLMCQEIVVQGREDAFRYIVQPHSFIVELRTGHWQEDEYNVEQEERG